MILHEVRGRARAGFTLIELLVVIAIIAVLMSLLMAGVMAVLQARLRAQTQYEIGKLGSSASSAMGEYLGKPKTLPGKLVLSNNLANYTSQPAVTGVTPADWKNSKAALTKMFGPKLFQSGTYVSWDGSGSKTNISVLEGQQCLVFYLGGIATGSSGAVKMNGFSQNPVDPSDIVGTKERFGPYYEFPSNRLVSGYGAPPGFYNFLDPYASPGSGGGGMPYFYTGGTGSSNSYVWYGPSLGGVKAYATDATGTLFENPTTFQIISAGRNQKFGLTGNSSQVDAAGQDDLTNFTRAVLGAGK